MSSIYCVSGLGSGMEINTVCAYTKKNFINLYEKQIP